MADKKIRQTGPATDALLAGSMRWQQRPTDTAVPVGRLAADYLAQRQAQWAQQTALVDAWNALLPPGLKDHCRLFEHRGRTLVVIAEPGVYRHQLEIMKIELLKRLKALCPKAPVSRIEIITSRHLIQEES